MELSERLKELEGKASRAPWQIRFGGRDEDSGFCMASKIGNNVVCERWPATGATEYNPHDPRLIMELVNNLPAIIAALDSSEHKAKCVQFAEDMEKLEDINEEVSFYDRQGEKLCSCFFQGVDRLYVGSDIYTAARKAAEALVKGERT